ncbi:acyl carrier protein [Sphingomonas sp. BK580]|uniref:acyl carrier protein n=1 Tax=Sphingomonas sp. BK580 TaxID=2586972 RepID=UPI0016159F8A|nr:acyl carrier protein [Sphingomonas sp. BK580]MBB3693777.1 acyl carrier protein [Sphingomonas sp. BK580]
MSKVPAILAEIRPDVDFAATGDFFEEGALDSFDLVTLVAELDRVYGISIDGMDIVPAHFASVASIEALLARYGVAA